MKKLSLLSLQRSWSIPGLCSFSGVGLLHPVTGASRSLFLSGIFILASGFLNAQTQPFTQEELNSQLHLQAQPHFERLPTGEKMFSWIGQSGFSYFIQASPDLIDWTWAPNIEAGVDALMSYEVDGPNAAGFFRLVRTDQTAADLDAADFDGDGLSNNFELTPRPRPGGIIGFGSLNPNIQTHPLRADTDGDGLSDKWELENGFDPTDNGTRLIDNGPNGDPDNDGVTNLNEQRLGTQPKGNATTTDSDGDGTLDFEDAVPGDHLVSWKRTPESSYALIEIETPYANPSPQDLNDKGEVLFPNGIWAGGTWIPKAAPELTGFLPDSESEAFPNGIGYIVTSLGWDFFNNDRKLLQIAYVHPTDGPGIDSAAPSPVFWNEGASSPSLVYETANLWDTPYWSASPIGVSTAGDLIIRSSYPDSVHRLERFGPSGALTGSMDGSDGYHPSGNAGHGDSTGVGWVASNLTRPASSGQSAAHKVGLWDASNYPIALPAQAEGWGYPVRAKDLPNGKVVLTAGADNGTTTTGRVFLPNPSGQYEYATKLADKNIELFAGDGSALTSDGRLWRNGDLVPMADLCPRYKELLDNECIIQPQRSNKNGVFLVKIESSTGSITTALLAPVEIEQNDYTIGNGIKFCRWLDAFQGIVFDNEFANKDRDRFRIKIPAVLPSLAKIRIKSTGINGAVINGSLTDKSTDGDYDVEMKQENGAMVSNWMLLVSDGDDDISYNGKGLDNETDDQTLLADFDSKIIVNIPDYNNSRVEFSAQRAVGKVTLDIAYLSPSGTTPPDKFDSIIHHVAKMREVYRQIGIRVDLAGIRGEQIPQTLFDAVANPSQPANQLSPAECDFVTNKIRSYPAPNKIRLGFVDATLIPDVYFPSKKVYGFTDLGSDGGIISLEANARIVLGVTAHEVGHALGLDHNPSGKIFLMTDGGLDWLNNKRDSKRFLEGDFKTIEKKKAYYEPLQ